MQRRRKRTAKKRKQRWMQMYIVRRKSIITIWRRCLSLAEKRATKELWASALLHLWQWWEGGGLTSGVQVSFCKGKRTPKSTKQWSTLLILLQGRSSNFLLPQMHPATSLKQGSHTTAWDPAQAPNVFCLIHPLPFPDCLAGWISEKDLQKGSNVTREKVPKIPDPISHQCYRKVCSINMVDQVVGCALLLIALNILFPTEKESQRLEHKSKNMAHDVSLSASHLLRCSLNISWRNMAGYYPRFLKTRDALGCLLEEIGLLFSSSMHKQEISVGPSLLDPHPWRDSRTAVGTEGDHPSRGPDKLLSRLQWLHSLPPHLQLEVVPCDFRIHNHSSRPPCSSNKFIWAPISVAWLWAVNN